MLRLIGTQVVTEFQKNRSFFDFS